MNSQSCFFLCFFFHSTSVCCMSTGKLCFWLILFNGRQHWEQGVFLLLRSQSTGSRKTFQLIATCLQSTWNRFALTAAAAQSHNLGLYVVFLPELFSQSKTSETQLFFFSAFCTDAHLHFSFRCDGWIRAKDWSSVSRGCSRCQRIHRKVGMLCSGKVSPLLVKLSMLTGT